MSIKLLKSLAVVIIAMFTLASCTSMHKSMKEANVRVELQKEDFNLSDQVSASASSTRILGIDFDRLFLKKTGTAESASQMINIAYIPVVGSFVVDPTANYALYELMVNNPGYDVVFYPQFETKVERPIGFGFLYKKTHVTATARLGKLK
jgi:hypothetical protein